MSEYISLHNHTDYSMGDSIIKVNELVSKNNGTIAITDHGTISGWLDFNKECEKNNVKPIFGCEFYCVDNYKDAKTLTREHLILLAKDEIGMKQIQELNVKSYKNFYKKPIIDYESIFNLESGHLVCLSACGFGKIPQLIMNDAPIEDIDFWINKFKNFFKDDFYLELQPHYFNEFDSQVKINASLMELSKSYDIPLVITTDSHYLDKNDAKFRNMRIATAWSNSYESKVDYTLSSNYLCKDESELFDLVAEYNTTALMYDESATIGDSVFDECLDNSVAIGEKCNAKFPDYEKHIPRFTKFDEYLKLINVNLDIKGKDNKTLLHEICFEKLKNKDLLSSAYIKRLEEELSLICDNDLQDYFFNNSFIINYFKNKGVFFGPGRGSAGGSLIAFLLRITEVDPLKFNLSFARFLNKGRVENNAMPDIDTDVQKSKRKDVIKETKEIHGENKTFNVVNFNRYQIKNAIKDISKALGISFQQVNSFTKKLDVDNLEELLQNKSAQNFFKQYPEVKLFLPKMLGLIRNYGVHAGAIVLFPDDIENYMGVIKVGDVLCTCYDKKLEDKGYLKLDLLGLETLDIIKYVLDTTDAKLPREYNDTKVFKTINKPLGIFQLEQQSGIKYLNNIQIESFEDLYNALALIRPGSQDTGDTDKYIERKKDPSKIQYDHVDLIPILKETLGLVVYQEQQQEIVKVFGGFNDAESDDIRRAIGKKNMELMNSYEETFKLRGEQLNYYEQLLTLLWSKLLAAGNYSFNKSHAVEYAIISYFTAYLKTYYLPEFLIALANFSDEKKRIKVFNKFNNESIKILLPDINHAQAQISKFHDNIMLGFEVIDGVGEKAIEDILSKRPFKSYNDFLDKKDSRRVNKRVVRALIESGAFDNFGYQRDMLFNLNENGLKMEDTLVPYDYETWSTQEKLYREFKRVKLSPNMDLIDYYDDIAFDDIVICKISDLEDIHNYNDIYIKGLISSYQSKGNYGFLEISDSTNTMSMVINSFQQDKYFNVLNDVGKPVLARVKSRKGNTSLSFLIDLTDENKETYKEEYGIVTGSSLEYLKELEKKLAHVNLGVVTDVSHFVSSNGNKCCSFNIVMTDQNLNNKISCMDVLDIMDGDILGFYPSGKDFIKMVETYKPG